MPTKINPPRQRRAPVIADWIEILAVLTVQPLSVDALTSYADEKLTRTDIGMGMREIGNRARVLGDAYPFSVGGGIAVDPERLGSAWIALLLMTPGSPGRTVCDVQEASEVFEKIIEQASRCFFGHHSKSLRFGWPSDNGRPRHFPDAVRWLADKMGISVGDGYRPPFRKDGGVDVVVWRDFQDQRSGFPVALVQCTLEKDFKGKVSDVDVRLWASWLKMDFDPITALAVPAVVPSGEVWSQLSGRTILLDRIRICGLMHEGSDAENQQSSSVWAAKTLQDLGTLR